MKWVEIKRKDLHNLWSSLGSGRCNLRLFFNLERSFFGSKVNVQEELKSLNPDELVLVFKSGNKGRTSSGKALRISLVCRVGGTSRAYIAEKTGIKSSISTFKLWQHLINTGNFWNVLF